MRRKAAEIDAAAADEAEGRKLKRYGPGQGGVTVQPAAVEAWGRFGDGMQNLLEALGAQWADKTRSGPAAMASTVRRWCAEIGIAVARAFSHTLSQAVTADSAASGDAGWAHADDGDEGVG